MATSGATTTVNFSLDVPINYVYDELGRLVAVVDANGAAASYAYDAVGNLLSISRQGASQASLLRFSPASGVTFTTVTIYGTGFSATASQNAVTFNGVAATVTSSSPSVIVTSVPTGATTGTIAVTSPTGSATSNTSFTVTASPSGAPTITGFTPTIGIPGAAVTISGTNFEPTALNNRSAFNIVNSTVSAATSTSITTSVPQAGSGRISVTTPNGKAVSSEDFFIPPSPYTAANVVFTGRMTIGTSSTATINTAGKIGLMLFDGTIGQQVSLNVTSVTVSAYVSIYNPDGTALRPAQSVDGGYFFDPVLLPATGTYTMLISPGNPFGSQTGNLTFTLYNAPEITSTITPGGAARAVTTTAPGQNARLTFSGTAGQRISLRVTGVTFANTGSISIFNPLGTTLFSTALPYNGQFIDTQTLSATGTYTILLDPYSTNTGSATVTLYNVVDITGSITPGGSSVMAALTTPGQNARLTFSGTTGQRVSLNITSVTIAANTPISILKPDGTTLVSVTSFGTSGAFIDSTSLPVTGTYTVLADPPVDFTGNMTLTLYEVTADVTGSVTIGGAAVNVSINNPGQNGQLTFSGTSGQQVTVLVTSNTMGTVTIKLLKPDGTTLTTGTSSAGSFNLSTQTLPTTGTYTISIDPSGANTGSMSVGVTSP